MASKPPPELALPPLEAMRGAHWGSALAGPQADVRAPAQQEDNPPALYWEVIALERWPAAWQQVPLERDAGLVIEAGSEQLLAHSSRLGARLWKVTEGALDAATVGRTRELFRERSVLPLGSTQMLELSPRETASDILAELARPQGLELAIGREVNRSVRLVLRVEGQVLDVPHDAEDLLPGDAHDSPADAASSGKREWISLQGTWNGTDQSFSLLMHSPFDGEASALLIRLRMAAGDDSPEQAEALARVRASLEDRTSQQVERIRTREELEARRAGIERALRAVTRAENRRAALSFVASSAGARLTEELAAAISEPELDRLLEVLAAAGDPARLALEDASLGWTLERVALEFVLSHADEDGLRGPWLSRMSLRVGALALSVEDVRDMVRRSGSLADFDNLLIAENKIALEDSSASVRVRAFDWLAVRKQSPSAFDPLGAEEVREDRLDALEAMQEAPEDQP